MDLVSGLIALAVVIIFFLGAYFMSMTLMKEKTYDEVKAEQQKPPKEKKVLKKVNPKKNPVKVNKNHNNNQKQQQQSEEAANQVDAKHHPGHVDFKPPEIVLLNSEEPPKPKPKENKKKKEKVKSILVNKNDPKVIADKPPVVNNKFVVIHPKDDLELKRSLSREEVSHEAEPKVKERGEEKEKSSNQSKKKSEKHVKEKVAVEKREAVVEEEAPAELPSKPQREPREARVAHASKDVKNDKSAVDSGDNHVAHYYANNNGPTSPSRYKKKKSLSYLLNMIGDKDVVNVTVLMPLIQKAELSVSETQTLIEALLNKQAPTASSAEWLQGRKDPVVKLEKQLAEKEKALAEQQEAMLAFQNKLKELRAELNSEKHLTRQLGESAQSYQKNIEAVTSRLQIISDEKQQLAAQIQQLQNQLSRTMEEKTDFLSRRQQLEIHIAHINDQNQQAMVAMEVQFGAQLQERDNRILQLQAECEDHIQNCTILQEQLNQESVASSQVQQFMRQLEESQAVQEKLEHHLSGAQFEVVRLQNELKKITDELDIKHGEIDKLNMTVHSTLQENQRLREENERLSKQVVESTVEARQLRDENESLAAQVTANTERPAAEGHENPDLEQEVESSLNKISQQLKEKEQYIEKLEEDLKNKENCINSLHNDIKNYTNEIKNLNNDFPSKIRSNEMLNIEVEKLKKSVNELTQELSEEKRKAQVLLDKTKQAEQKSVREFLQSLYPNFSLSETEDHSVWLNKFESCVKNSAKVVNNNNNTKQFNCQTSEEQTSTVLSEVEKQNDQLREMVMHYKTIISDTEGMLNQLQLHVEQEEIKWRQQIKSLEAQLQQAQQGVLQEGNIESCKKVASHHESALLQNGSDQK